MKTVAARARMDNLGETTTTCGIKQNLKNKRNTHTDEEEEEEGEEGPNTLLQQNWSNKWVTKKDTKSRNENISLILINYIQEKLKNN